MEDKFVYTVVDIDFMYYVKYKAYGIYPTTFDNYEEAKKFFEERKKYIIRFMFDEVRPEDTFEITQNECGVTAEYIVKDKKNKANTVGVVLRRNKLFEGKI